MYEDGIYSPGPVKPVCKIMENVSAWTGGQWEHYRVLFIEPMPRSSPTVVETVIAAAGTALAAGGTIAKRVVAILQLNTGEFLHLRWEPLDNVEGILWEQSGQGRLQSRAMVARVTKDTGKYDPYLSTTTFFIIGRDRDMNLEVRNNMAYATPMARFQFWGFRYVLEDLTSGMTDTDKSLLRKGDLKAIKSLIGTTTFLPAEGRTS